ncbi:hypothetical protein AAVH_42791, partial [Aphelenchoides avenae]
MATQESDHGDSEEDRESSGDMEEYRDSKKDEKEVDPIDEEKHVLKRWPGSESLNMPDQSGGKGFGIKCKHCNKTFPRMSKFNNHMNTHAAYEELPHKCRRCGRKYASSWTLQ